ncbi:hypothetical protein DFP72DRAFT_839416 [Ephemerocybe angulata]|uniref:Uncharacterized protein n=1 Tax=Ephemerocybe angulata TaxID=980116 RepID=A0A8H6MH10_9AGAR|nr:hypothetical protein DFP72DRAFT_839416 [Tulosesus angulatus]
MFISFHPCAKLNATERSTIPNASRKEQHPAILVVPPKHRGKLCKKEKGVKTPEKHCTSATSRKSQRRTKIEEKRVRICNIIIQGDDCSGPKRSANRAPRDGANVNMLRRPSTARTSHPAYWPQRPIGATKRPNAYNQKGPPTGCREFTQDPARLVVPACPHSQRQPRTPASNTHEHECHELHPIPNSTSKTENGTQLRKQIPHRAKANATASRKDEGRKKLPE